MASHDISTINLLVLNDINSIVSKDANEYTKGY